MSEGKSTVLQSSRVYAGRIVKLDLERVRFPNGGEGEVEVIHHAGAAAMVPLRDDGSVLLIRQYRHATGQWLYEVPAGTLQPGESPEECAARELIEESGHAARELVPLGAIWTTPGFTDERIWLYLARGLSPAEQRLDDDELLSVEPTPLARAVAMAEHGELADAKSICALLRAAAYLRP